MGRVTEMNAFAAISEPTRRAILDLVLERPRSVGEISKEFPGISQPGISKHLRALRRANLVKVTIKAQKRVYSLNDSGFQEINEWISKYQKFWSQRLDNLQVFLDSARDQENKS